MAVVVAWPMNSFPTDGLGSTQPGQWVAAVKHGNAVGVRAVYHEAIARRACQSAGPIGGGSPSPRRPSPLPLGAPSDMAGRVSALLAVSERKTERAGVAVLRPLAPPRR